MKKHASLKVAARRRRKKQLRIEVLSNNHLSIATGGNEGVPICCSGDDDDDGCDG